MYTNYLVFNTDGSIYGLVVSKSDDNYFYKIPSTEWQTLSLGKIEPDATLPGHPIDEIVEILGNLENKTFKYAILTNRVM